MATLSELFAEEQLSTSTVSPLRGRRVVSVPSGTMCTAQGDAYVSP